ncbi:MAG TPA: metal ABC transporter ATP-binding protein [Clostridia bacterium]|nr:metal ABC transporter ATP-binding protein [Clostridia bacterium]
MSRTPLDRASTENHTRTAEIEDFPAVEVCHVHFYYQGKVVLDDVTIRVDPGRFLGIIGPNGAGKTTLLKTVLGILPVDTGTVRIFGQDPRGARMNRQIGYVPQRLNFERDFPVSVMDVVLMGVKVKRFPWLQGPTVQGLRIRRAEELIKRVGLSGLEKRPIASISGGQQQRAFLAQALCIGPRVLILDEPTTGLDFKGQREFYALVKNLQGETGLTVVAASHDLEALAYNADELVVLDKRIWLRGKPDDVLNSTELKRIYGIRNRAVLRG